MCGIFYVFSKNQKLNKQTLEEISAEFIKPRGPCNQSIYSSKNEYAYQSTLAIQSADKLIKKNNNLDEKSFILYNGEIYSDSEQNKFTRDTIDTDYLYKASNNNLLKQYIKACDGMYALAEIKSIASDSKSYERSISIYRDPTGEKHLYYWISNDYIVLSSVPGSIALFISSLNRLELDLNQLKEYISKRHFISPLKVPFKGIRQLLPGHTLNFNTDTWEVNGQNQFITNLDLINENTYKELKGISYTSYLDRLEFELIKSLHSQESVNNTKSAGLTISGGIDSSLTSALILNHMENQYESFTCRFGDKDKTALKGNEISVGIGCKKHNWVDINLEKYHESLIRSIKLLASPVHSHSHPSSHLLAKQVSSNGHKVLYGGEGADELFLGYHTYIEILNRISISEETTSDYTCNIRTFDNKQSHSETDIYIKDCFQKAYEIFNNTYNSNKLSEVKSNAYCDYFVQLPMVGLSACDTIISDCSVEARTMFTRKNIIEFALNSPVEYLLGNSTQEKLSKFKSTPKNPLNKLYTKYISNDIDSKIGFSGYPNETSKFLGDLNTWRVFDLLPDLRSQWKHSRALDWKIINCEWFLNIWDI